jgi:hypothetical protein
VRRLLLYGFRGLPAVVCSICERQSCLSADLQQSHPLIHDHKKQSSNWMMTLQAWREMWRQKNAAIINIVGVADAWQ